MRSVTAFLPLALVLYQALSWAALVWSGKASFHWSGVALYALGLFSAVLWARLIWRQRKTTSA